jgi:hypothetical protein
MRLISLVIRSVQPGRNSGRARIDAMGEDAEVRHVNRGADQDSLRSQLPQNLIAVRDVLG